MRIYQLTFRHYFRRVLTICRQYLLTLYRKTRHLPKLNFPLRLQNQCSLQRLETMGVANIHKESTLVSPPFAVGIRKFTVWMPRCFRSPERIIRVIMLARFQIQCKLVTCAIWCNLFHERSSGLNERHQLHSWLQDEETYNYLCGWLLGQQLCAFTICGLSPVDF